MVVNHGTPQISSVLVCEVSTIQGEVQGVNARRALPCEPHAELEVPNFQFAVGPRLGKIFHDEAAVTMVRPFLAAKQAAAVEEIPREVFLDSPLSHESQECILVGVPGSLVLFESIEDILRRGENRFVHVIDSSDRVQEVFDVIAFGEASELRTVVQTNIDDPLYTGVD